MSAPLLPTELLRIESRRTLDVGRAHLRRMLGRSDLPAPIVLNSLPKSGTHLGIKLLESMPGVTRIRLQIAGGTSELLKPTPGEPTLDVGVAIPRDASLRKVRRWLEQIPRGAFLTAHVPHTETFAGLLRELGFVMVLMLRDPRDVAVSTASYLSAKNNHLASDAFESLDQSDRILAAITGVEVGQGRLRDLRDRVEVVLGWSDEDFTTVLRFEDLVGAKGGGDEQSQLDAVGSAAAGVGISLTSVQVHAIADNLHGGTPTFRRGRIGGWSDVFETVHREAAAPLLSDLLIDLGYEEDDTWGAVGD